MALNGSYYWNSEYPKMRIDVSYSQTARTGSSATYSVSVALYFTSSGWYGYGMNGRVTINGTSQEIRFKNPSPSWDGSGYKGTWTFNITASAGATGGTLPANVRVWGTDGDGTVIDSGSQVVSLSTWNTAPTWTGDGNVNGWTSAHIIPENTNSVTVNFPGTKDNEGNTVYYDVYRYVNGSSNAKIASGTTARSITDNISGIGQGTRIKYMFQAHDGSLWTGSDKWTVEHTTNIFYPGELTGSGVSIGYDTTQIKLNVSAARNTNGNDSFSYRIGALNGINVTNGNFTPDSNGQVTVTVYKGGTRPSGPHVDFEQLKDLTIKGGYTGSIVFRLYSGNTYGSNGYTDVSVPVNLRTNPVPAVLNSPTGEVTVAGGKYFVWNLSTVSISWADGVDKLYTGDLSYELQYKYGSGTWTRLTTTTGTSWSGKLGEVAAQSTCYFRVIATTTYGYSATSGEKSITMHYYKPPAITVSNQNRTQSEFSVLVNSSTNTSIAAVAISNRTFTGISKTDKTFTGASTTIKDTGLEGDSNYNLTIKVTDNSGLSNATTTVNVNVAQYIPIVSISDTGVAINVLPDSNYKLKVGGSARIEGVVAVDELNNRGYQTKNTGSGDAGKWGLVATITFNAQYQEVNSIIDYIDSGSGGTNPTSGRLILRAKQQAAITNAPLATMFLTDYLVSSPESFKLILTENTASKSVLQLWFRNIQSYSQVYFSPTKTTGATTCITFHEGQSLQTSLPSGTQIPCYKIVNNTPGDIGAMAEGGTYDTLTLYNWIRTSGNTGWYNETYQGGWYMTDGTWIRNYNNKSVYINTTLRADGGIQVGNDGNKFRVGSDGSVSATGEAHFSTGTYTDPLQGTACAIKASGRIACNIVHAQSYRFVETNAQITSRSGSSGGFDFWATGDGGSRITFDGVKIYKVVNGTWTVIAG